METNFGYCDKDTGFFSSDERRWISKIRKLKKKFPDLVTVLAEPESNDGCIYCKLPADWLKITPSRSLTMTDEQKAAIIERFARAKA